MKKIWSENLSHSVCHLAFEQGIHLMRKIAVAFLASAFCSPAFGASEQYAKVGPWNIAYAVLDNGNAYCFARIDYPDHAFMIIESFTKQPQPASEKSWIVGLHHPSWERWIEKGKEYSLLIQTPLTRWSLRTVGVVTEDKTRLLVGFGLSPKAINTLALDNGGDIFIQDPYRLNHRFAMSTSAAAIREVVHCRDAHEQTVAEKPKEDGIVSGTGFFVSGAISQLGRILTNQHVVDGCSSVTVGYTQGQFRGATVIAHDNQNDLAILETDLPAKGVATFRQSSVKLAEAVSVFGFPFAGILSASGNFTMGNVTSLAGIGDDTRLVQFSNPVQPGNSGGPLLDQRASVVGVVTARLEDTGQQNVNFAIKSAIVLNFIDANGVTVSTTPRSPAPADPTEVAEIAKQFSVQVLCSHKK
jgi:serine protease Do